MLLEFFGQECPHCAKMESLVAQLEQEDAVRLEKYEVWHNTDNLKKMEDLDKGRCGGVPFFMNTETQKSICGETSYEELKKWALGLTEFVGHSPVHNLEYNLITDGIYVGNNLCCQNHFDEKLRTEGLEADLSLEETKIDAPFGAKYYLWLPLPDHTAPTPEQLDLGVTFLQKMVALGKKTYVHCQHGHGRAPTLVAAYLIKQGKTAQEAMDFVKSKRPSIHLDQPQVDALIAFSGARPLQKT